MKIQELTPQFVKFIPQIKEQGIIYISLEYETSNHLCACGCGEQTVLPFNKEYGWKLEIKDNKVTFRPSIGNFGIACKSHYWITENKIVWA